MQTKLFFRETNTLTHLAIPLIASGIIESSLGFFSTLFLAHLGPRALAAGSLVGWVFATLMVLIWGSFSVISVLVAQRHGAKNVKGVARILRDSLMMAFIVSVPMSLLVWNAGDIFLYFGQKPETVAMSLSYLHALTWCILPDCIFMVLQQFIIGLGHTRTNTVFTLVWAPINIFISYILVFGKLGFPALGIAGIGWATTISMVIIAVLSAAYLLWQKSYRIYWGYLIHNPEKSSLLELFQVGMPMGFMFCIEVGFFLTLTLMMGYLGEINLAANQIVLQFVGVFFMITFCIAQAITVRIGHLTGAKETDKVTYTAYSGIFMTLIGFFIAATCYWVFPLKIIGFDLDIHAPQNQEIIAVTLKLLAVVAIFQLVDDLRICLFGVLRGFGDTNFTLWSSLFIFWVVAIPLSFMWLKYFSGQAVDLWIIATIASSIGVILLRWRMVYLLKKDF